MDYSILHRRLNTLCSDRRNENINRITDLLEEVEEIFKGLNEVTLSFLKKAVDEDNRDDFYVTVLTNARDSFNLELFYEFQNKQVALVLENLKGLPTLVLRLEDVPNIKDSSPWGTININSIDTISKVIGRLEGYIGETQK